MALLYLHGYIHEVLLIAALRHLRLNSLTVDILLQGEEYLVGVDGLDEVVGNLRADGLVHDILLLTLRHHDDGCGWLYVPDELQRLKTAQSWHLLV